MANARLDLTGKRVGAVTALHPAEATNQGGVVWSFKCDCGNTFERQGSLFLAGRLYRCRQCYLDQRPKRPVTPTPKRTKEERPKVIWTTDERRTYNSWKSMKARCRPGGPYDKNYSVRGIVIECERWANFREFLKDMGLRPANKTLDRIDNDRGYSPENCRWATAAEQVRNSRQVRLMKTPLGLLTNTQVGEALGFSTAWVCKKVKLLGWDAAELWVANEMLQKFKQRNLTLKGIYEGH